MGQALSSYISAGQSIDTLWHIFLGLHIVLFAGIFRSGHKFRIGEKAIIISGYSMFAFLNCRALLGLYELFMNIKKDIVISSGAFLQEKSSYANVIIGLQNSNFDDRAYFVWGIHVATYVVVCVSVGCGYSSKKQFNRSPNNTT